MEIFLCCQFSFGPSVLLFIEQSKGGITSPVADGAEPNAESKLGKKRKGSLFLNFICGALKVVFLPLPSAGHCRNIEKGNVLF